MLYKSEHGAPYVQAASQNEVHVSRRKPNYHAEIEAVNLSCQPKIHAFENPEDINRHTASQVKPSVQN